MRFWHFAFETRLAPQRLIYIIDLQFLYIYIYFEHLNFQKWSKVLRTWCALNLLISKRASCHNGVQFLISHLTRWLRTRRLSEPTFRPPGAAKTFEKQRFATFLPFCAPASSFFWLFLFSDFFFFVSLLWLFPHLLFHRSILSEVWLLNFFGL